ncbi:GNAT family N-acetyltransferase [Paenibacillus silvae]|uniref:GNAT family N-acetyltransferase n=1 Tax=Paenibacillus silvae TaxID=1325358 RepID=UPI0011A9E1E6|nr:MULTISPECIES: GNAT family N-acetyltransferase [Paenibacillus]MCK6073896.1 GNAT family N-acetyltransferase [Paenibacillus silvae]MCK6148628.1 GNAT family N-acetyltransferase [Paenibacillus silvae]MCK6266928.1 GNAT family N-acetyltransferase [Paenibacillus silvae]
MYHYRTGQKKDLAQVIELTICWTEEDITLGYENVAWTPEKLEKKLNDYFYVVELQDVIVGYAFGDIRRGNAEPVIPQADVYLELHEVYIHPEHRRKGIGRELVQCLLNQAQQHQVERALVGSSNRSWKDTAAFYEELGFQMWYIQMYR